MELCQSTQCVVLLSFSKMYPPPDLPRDYKPIHYFRPVIKVSSENSHLEQTLAESTGKLESDTARQSRHQKTTSQRRELLGETSLKGIQHYLALCSLCHCNLDLFYPDVLLGGFLLISALKNPVAWLGFLPSSTI